MAFLTGGVSCTRDLNAVPVRDGELRFNEGVKHMLSANLRERSTPPVGTIDCLVAGVRLPDAIGEAGAGDRVRVDLLCSASGFTSPRLSEGVVVGLPTLHEVVFFALMVRVDDRDGIAAPTLVLRLQCNTLSKLQSELNRAPDQIKLKLKREIEPGLGTMSMRYQTRPHSIRAKCRLSYAVG